MPALDAGGFLPKISILMAVHNGGRFLREAIASIASQQYGNWELIAVSNGSTDETVEICEEFSAHDNRIRTFRVPEKNKNRAYNLAYERSVGDYICFFAADDVLPPGSLSQRIAILRGEEANAFSTCCLQTMSGDPKYDGLIFPKNVEKANYSGGSMLFPRVLAERIFPLPEAQPNEDTWTSLHLRAWGENRHVPKPLYLYRIHGGNSYGYGMSYSDKRTQYLRRMHAYQLFYDKYSHMRLSFVCSEVAPFLEGLGAAIEGNLRRILLVKGLNVGNKMVLVLYSSPTLYRVRNAFFRALSRGLAG